MNLVLDWGNTLLKGAIFNKKNEPEILTLNSSDYKSELISLSKEHIFENIIISSVINTPNWVADVFSNQNLIILSHSTPLPIKNDYETPTKLGNDRIANATGANKLFPDQNTLTIDIGTCIKFDFIDKTNNYKGGSISPGFEMRFKALNQNTDQLPFINKTIPKELIGNSTKQSITSGVYFGMQEEIKGIINHYEDRYSNLNIIITGGDAFYFEKALKNSIFAHSFLTLYGLNEILNYNAK